MRFPGVHSSGCAYTIGMKRALPVLLLFFLAPAIGELLSGSSPPVEFFQPFTFLLLAALYGSGAVLAREAAVRWRVGWRGVALLGLAYGVLEEGLMVKSWFDPTWMDLGRMAVYGRWMGVNWAWAVMLTIYHAVFSISIPILITHLVFPRRAGQAWLGRGWLILFGALLGGVTLLGHFGLTPYRPPLALTLPAIALVAGLVWLARRLKPAEAASPAQALPTPAWRFGAAGFGLTLLLFALGWAVPATPVPAWADMLLMAGLAALTWGWLARLGRRGRWLPIQQAAFLTGALGFFVLLAPLTENDPTRADNPAGMFWVSFAAAIMLAVLLWHAWRSGMEENTA